VRYGTGPLLVPAEVVSPHCGTYLTLLMKADQLFGLLEYQRLRGLLTNAECDREFARVELKGVQRTALNLAMGLRRRLNDALPTVARPTERGDEGVAGDEEDVSRVQVTG
jgi:hypothetical protein